MARDYKAQFFFTEDSLARLATNHRRRAQDALCPDFDVISYLEDVVLPSRNMTLVLFDAGNSSDVAYVVPRSRTCFLDNDLYKLARLGEPDARYKVAHETAHSELHTGDPHYYSSPDARARMWLPDEQKTEWQAHRYAEYLLLPDWLVRAFSSPTELALGCSVSIDLATRRWRTLHRYSGDPCPECHNFTLVRNGTCLKCDTCGSTTGCS